MQIPNEKEMFVAGVHFGHKPSSWHPNMSDFIYGQKNNVQIIDLEKTSQYLKQAAETIKTVASENKKILFIGTKVQAKQIVEKHALEAGVSYITHKWLGGTLTNFKVIRGMVKKMEDLEKMSEEEDYEKKYTKKERQDFKDEIDRLDHVVGGIRHLDKLPDLIFIASAKDEKTAVQEAMKKNIKTIAICDTNSNPNQITYPIPGNDDATKSLELITNTITMALKEGKQEAKKEETQTTTQTKKDKPNQEK